MAVAISDLFIISNYCEAIRKMSPKTAGLEKNWGCAASSPSPGPNLKTADNVKHSMHTYSELKTKIISLY